MGLKQFQKEIEPYRKYIALVLLLIAGAYIAFQFMDYKRTIDLEIEQKQEEVMNSIEYINTNDIYAKPVVELDLGTQRDNAMVNMMFVLFVISLIWQNLKSL